MRKLKLKDGPVGTPPANTHAEDPLMPGYPQCHIPARQGDIDNWDNGYDHVAEAGDRPVDCGRCLRSTKAQAA